MSGRRLPRLKIADSLLEARIPLPATGNSLLGEDVPLPFDALEGLAFGTFVGDMVGPLRDFMTGVMDVLFELIGDSFRTDTGDLLTVGNDF